MSRELELSTACTAYAVAMVLFCYRKKLSFAQAQAFILFTSVDANRDREVGEYGSIRDIFVHYLAGAYRIFEDTMTENVAKMKLDEFLKADYREMLDKLGELVDDVNEVVENAENT